MVATKPTTSAKAKTPKMVTVYGKAAPGQKRGVSLFTGTEEDAETFVANHFPRIHSEEAGPDYTVESSDDSTETE